MPDKHTICPAEEIPPGSLKIVNVDGSSIGIFNIDGEFYALANVCPHQLAPLCKGRMTGTVSSSEVGEYNWEREGRILRCPWHGWEFDITTGASVFNPHGLKARNYEVDVENISEENEDIETYGTELAGDEPPVETYPVEVEKEYVVVYK
jgi:nitrite reductase/ring-hydroxylating ferredoxin subunit